MDHGQPIRNHSTGENGPFFQDQPSDANSSPARGNASLASPLWVLELTGSVESVYCESSHRSFSCVHNSPGTITESFSQARITVPCEGIILEGMCYLCFICLLGERGADDSFLNFITRAPGNSLLWIKKNQNHILAWRNIFVGKSCGINTINTLLLSVQIGRRMIWTPLRRVSL